MRNGLKFLGMAAAAALTLTTMAAQDAVVIKRTAKVGDVAKYRMKAEMEAQGMPVSFTALISDKVIKVAENGDITTESSQVEGKVTFSGQEMEIPANGPSSTITHPTGEIVSVTSEQSDLNTYRVAHLQGLQFPVTPLKIGDSWTVTINKDNNGSVPAKGTYKLEAKEKVGDVDAYRVKGGLKESEGADPAAVDATYWISVKDGTLIKLAGTWTNFPVPQMGPTTMKLTMTREG